MVNQEGGFVKPFFRPRGRKLAQQGKSEFLQPEQSDPPMTGSGGWEIFRFMPTSTGQETLELIYRRSWETDAEPAKTFSIEVTVN